MIQVFEDEKSHEQNTQPHLSRQGSFMATQKSDDKWAWKEEDEAKQNAMRIKISHNNAFLTK